MNWSKAYRSLDEFKKDVHPDNGMDVETGHQIVLARNLVFEAITSGVIGNTDNTIEDVPVADFRIDIGGFASPSHENKDWITISIRSI